MDETLAKAWQNRFGSGPPKWVDRFSKPQDVDEQINECNRRISDLKERLEQEVFVLSWLEGLSKRGTFDSKETLKPREGPGIHTADEKEVNTEYSSFLRQRVFDHVNVSDVQTVKRVKAKIEESNKHYSVTNFDSFHHSAKVSRQRSMSDSSAQRPQFGSTEERLSPIPDSDPLPLKQPPAQKQPSQVTPKALSSGSSESQKFYMELPESKDKRLSNGIHEYKENLSDDDSDLMSSVKTVIPSGNSISPNHLTIEGNLDGDEMMGGGWMECSGTLKRDMCYQRSFESGDKTPTGSLDASVGSMEKGITLSMVSEARSLSLDKGLNLKEAELIYGTHKDGEESDQEEDNGNEDEEVEEGERAQNEDAGSINDFENSGYHTFSNLAESTLTYILRDTIFASRSNSVSSLSTDALSPEMTPSHEVNLRPNSGKRKDRNRSTQERNRTAQVLRDFGSNDDITDEDKLQKMLLDLQDSAPSSPSSELSSGPSSPTHLVPYVKPVSVCNTSANACTCTPVCTLYMSLYTHCLC